MSAAPPSSTSSRRRILLLAGVVLLVATGIAVAAVLLSRGSAPARPARAAPTPTTSPTPTTRPHPPPRARFELELLPAIASTNPPPQPRHLSAKAAKKRLRARRHRRHRIVVTAAHHVRATVERLYTAGFMDPRRPASRWLRSFAAEARKRAWAARRRVTIGPLHRRVRALRQREGVVGVQVLLGRQGHPVTAYAAVRFRAVGRIGPRKKAVVRSRARFFLRWGGHGWVIYAFEVRRRDGRKRR